MKMTCKDAHKLLNQLDEQLSSIRFKEMRDKMYVAATCEDPEKVRPEYSYERSRDEQLELERKIIKLKHAINEFNVKTIVDGFNKTIDEMLIYIPQLKRRKDVLLDMKDKPKFERVKDAYDRKSNIIEYNYINYDAKMVEEDYKNVEDELSRAQIALDKVNLSCEFEVEL